MTNLDCRYYRTNSCPEENQPLIVCDLCKFNGCAQHTLRNTDQGDCQCVVCGIISTGKGYTRENEKMSIRMKANSKILQKTEELKIIIKYYADTIEEMGFLMDHDEYEITEEYRRKIHQGYCLINKIQVNLKPNNK